MPALLYLVPDDEPGSATAAMETRPRRRGSAPTLVLAPGTPLAIAMFSDLDRGELRDGPADLLKSSNRML